MSRRSDAISVEAGFDALEIGRLTWVGLTIAAIGWALLLGEASLADIVAGKAARQMSATFHADVVDIAKTVILSGFGLALIGAVQTGFGTLNRFFGAVLLRSGRREPAPEVHKAEPPAQPPIETRPYRTFPDGSVEVETILGTRLFKTMAEARDFIS